MKLTVPALFYHLLILFFSIRGNAQCPATLTLNVQSVTHASCPDNGSITLGGSGTGFPGVTYSIISGPSHVGMEQGSRTFNSLSAGTYQFRASCNGQTADVMATINNLYTPLNANFTITTSNVCTNYSPGGTITVSGVSGGRSPYTYSFIADPAANYDDALSSYSGSASFTSAVWGTFQVRVKDACGAFVTKTVTLQPAYPAAIFGGASMTMEDVACDSAGLWFWMGNDAWEGVAVADYPKLRFRVFEKAGPSCSPGALIKTFELSSGDNNYFIIPRRDVLVEITSPCGETRTNCYDYPDTDSLISRWKPVVKGCGSGPDPYTLTIEHQYNDYAKPPLNVKLYRQTGNLLLQNITTWDNWGCCSFTGLSMAHAYRIEVTDACGRADTVYITPPTGGAGLAPLDAGTYVDPECSYQDGKITVKLGITGLVSNLDTAVITITSGPDHIGATSTMNPYDGLFYFFEMTPGATYGFSLNNGCGITNLSFTVPNEDWRRINFTLTPSVSQQCGGSGTINSNIVYSGWGSYRSELWMGSTLIDENNSGLYSNRPPGLYTIRAYAEQTWCTGPTTYMISDTVRVFEDGTYPEVRRKIAYVCESGGVPTTSGAAHIQVAGFGPFRYELKRISPSPEAAYTTIASNAPANYTISGLQAYATYSLLVTDNCGKSTLTEIAVGTLGTLSFDTYYQPCPGDPYLVSAQQIPGATYSWVKDGSSVVLSTTKDLYFASYLPAYNGKYICTINFPGGCLQRDLSVNLQSIYCGSLLPVSFIHTEAKVISCKTMISWSMASADAHSYDIERSKDGVRYEKMATVEGVAGKTQFTYTDAVPMEGVQSYRVKARYDAGYSYSAAVNVRVPCNQKDAGVQVFPNPVKNNRIIAQINAAAEGASQIRLLNEAGQLVLVKNIMLKKQANKLDLDVSGLPAGIYFLQTGQGTPGSGIRIFKP